MGVILLSLFVLRKREMISDNIYIKWKLYQNIENENRKYKYKFRYINS